MVSRKRREGGDDQVGWRWTGVRGERGGLNRGGKGRRVVVVVVVVVGV